MNKIEVKLRNMGLSPHATETALNLLMQRYSASTKDDLDKKMKSIPLTDEFFSEVLGVALSSALTPTAH